MRCDGPRLAQSMQNGILDTVPRNNQGSSEAGIRLMCENKGQPGPDPDAGIRQTSLHPS